MSEMIHAVKILLYKREQNELRFLLTKENTGMYSFVGGAQDPEDKTIAETIKREIREELGLSALAYTLTPTDVTYKFIHSDPGSPRFGKKGMLHLFLGEYNQKEEMKKTDEVVDVFWLTEDKVREKLQNAYPYLLIAFEKAIKEL